MASNWEIPDNPDRPFPYTAEQLDEIFALGEPREERAAEFKRNAEAAYSRTAAARYPNRWVAASGGEIVADAATFGELQDALRAAGLLAALDIVRNFTGPQRLTPAQVQQAHA